MEYAAAATAAVTAGGSLMSANLQKDAGEIAKKEAETQAQIEELGAVQREGDRKRQLINAMAAANARAGASNVAAFEGSPLTILQEQIQQEETATERDLFNTRLSALTTRSRGRQLEAQASIGAKASLLKGLASAGQTAAAGGAGG